MVMRQVNCLKTLKVNSMTLSNQWKKEFQMMSGILGDALLKVLQPIVENIQANQNLDTEDRGMTGRVDVPETLNRLEGHEIPLGYPKEPQIKDFPKLTQQELVMAFARGLGQRNKGSTCYHLGSNVLIRPEGLEVHENPFFETNGTPRQEHWTSQNKGQDQYSGRNGYYGLNAQRPYQNDRFRHNASGYGHSRPGPPPPRRQDPLNYLGNLFHGKSTNGYGYGGLNPPPNKMQDPSN